MDRRGKVFGVGLARTGTTSLHEAMGILGLRSAPDSVALLEGLDVDFLERYDAFFDNPVPFRYRELDAACPGSRYIVTYRSVDRWLRSMAWLFGPGLDRLDLETRVIGDRVHQAVYGTTTFDADLLADVHARHYRDLRQWIRTRPHVWIDVDDGMDWAPVCELLHLPVPDAAFPHTNRQGSGSLRRGVGRWRARPR